MIRRVLNVNLSKEWFSIVCQLFYRIASASFRWYRISLCIAAELCSVYLPLLYPLLVTALVEDRYFVQLDWASQFTRRYSEISSPVGFWTITFPVFRLSCSRRNWIRYPVCTGGTVLVIVSESFCKFSEDSFHPDSPFPFWALTFTGVHFPEPSEEGSVLLFCFPGYALILAAESLGRFSEEFQPPGSHCWLQFQIRCSLTFRLRRGFRLASLVPLKLLLLPVSGLSLKDFHKPFLNSNHLFPDIFQITCSFL